GHPPIASHEPPVSPETTRRVGAENTVSQGTRPSGLRHSCCLWLAKAYPGRALTAAARNFARVVDGFAETWRGDTGPWRFAVFLVQDQESLSGIVHRD